MEIRTATVEDINAIMSTIDFARQQMRAHGNIVQWTNGYPDRASIMAGIAKKENYVCVVLHEIVGFFSFILGVEPTYYKIENGQWLNEFPYGVIHRLASNGKAKGVGRASIEWCLKQCPNIRIDTHSSNSAMKHLLLSLGFRYCGVIHVSDGTPRDAYQKTL